METSRTAQSNEQHEFLVVVVATVPLGKCKVARRLTQTQNFRGQQKFETIAICLLLGTEHCVCCLFSDYVSTASWECFHAAVLYKSPRRYRKSVQFKTVSQERSLTEACERCCP
eukprot:4263630-Amphidinium_carterae.1